MIKKLLSSLLQTLLPAFFLLISLPCVSQAQQLFISSMAVNFSAAASSADPTYDPYCVGIYRTDAANRSYGETGDGMNPWATGARIEFDQTTGKRTYYTGGAPVSENVLHDTYPGSCLALCVTVTCVSDLVFGIDDLKFEVFKYKEGSNPLDPGSTPPLRTFFMYNIGICTGTASGAPYEIGTYCTAWDGYYNLNGEFGKSNGQFGFRATVTTNRSDPDIGNIVIEQTSAYPGQNQIPIQVDVVNVHAIQSTPTVVGIKTPVAAAPYNIIYRMSKDAIVNMGIYSASNSGTLTVRRVLLNGVSRIGEGTPEGTLQNGDSWDGRDENGKLLPAGNYVLQIDATANDVWGRDDAFRVQRQVSIDPLQMTDFAISGLTALSTSQATISYMLTESATVYTYIYPPDSKLTDVNNVTTSPTVTDPSGNPVSPIRTFSEHKSFRTMVYSQWDGRDNSGKPVYDGSYLCVQWAEIPDGSGGAVRTAKYYANILPVSRGYVTVSSIGTSSSVLGSTPSVAGLDPFYFTYTLSRDATVNVNILTSTGALVRTLVNSESRSANFVNMEIWNGRDNSGYYVSSGNYMAEVVAKDAMFPEKETRKTAIFTADLFRIVDVKATSLLGGTTDFATISYSLSQTMQTRIEIYEPGTVIPTTGTWPVNVGNPVKVIEGVRPNRALVTESWDGIYNDTMARDGDYVFAIVAYSSGPVKDYTTGNISTKVYPTDRMVGKMPIARGPVYFNKVDVVPTIPTNKISSETVTLPPYQIKFQVSRVSSVTVQAINQTYCLPPRFRNFVCRYIEPGAVYSPDIVNSVYWDGRDEYGDYVIPDAYQIQLVAYNYPDTALQTPTTEYETLEVNPFQVYDLGITDISATQPFGVVSYQLSVPMKVAVQVFKPGTSFDSSGNPTPTYEQSLVKAIVGVRPPFTPIDEIWDGTDRSLTPVPDGLYVFRLVNSTDTALIDSVTGNVTGKNKAYISDPRAYVTANTIAVSKGEDADPCGSFAATTSFYPNPIRQSSGTFRITRVPVPGYYTLNLYNLAGDLVYQYDWGYQTPSSSYPNLEHIWRRVNASGRAVARGVYFAVLELKSTQGNRQVCQTVKKILIP
ncbi:MAG: FlgD immunoglobulin-like domain containing protein [Elusimicrobiaceae bacterium]